MLKPVKTRLFVFIIIIAIVLREVFVWNFSFSLASSVRNRT